MINTGSNNNINSTLEIKGMTIMDNVNEHNKEELCAVIDKADLYIDAKFPMPTSSEPPMLFEVNNLMVKVNDELNTIQTSMNKYGFSCDTQFHSFKVKVLFWCSGLFSSVIEKADTSNDICVVINHDLSKHEKLFIDILVKGGINFLIIPENIGFKYEKTTRVEDSNSSNLDNQSVSRFSTIGDIESALYDNNDIVKVIVSGVDNYEDTCNFYAKLKINADSNNNWILANRGFDKPSNESISKIPRFANTKHDYVITTLRMFNNVKGMELREEVNKAIDEVFNSGENKELNGQIFYNRLVYTICTLNEIFNKTVNCVVYYGEAGKNDTNVLNIISRLSSVSLIVVNSDKSSTPKIDCIEKLELKDSIEVFDIPLIDKRDNASTLAVDAQRRVDETLFSGDTLGMYKPGQFAKCDVVHFDTTYDEMVLWWNKEVYLRPGFKADGVTATVPNIFKIIKGGKEGYLSEVQKFCCGKTLLCKSSADIKNLYTTSNGMNIHRGTDINGTAFSDQIPFIENGKLIRNRIKQCKNYKYGLIAENKQDLILDAIEDIINNSKVNTQYSREKEKFIDTVLNVGLNMSMDVINNVQWFEFYTYNPNVVVVLTDVNMPSLEDFILLAIIQRLGWDVLVFVPTSYNSIEGYIGDKFNYGTNIIGEAIYDINTEQLHITKNTDISDSSSDNKKKTGFFKKIFSK